MLAHCPALRLLEARNGFLIPPEAREHQAAVAQGSRPGGRFRFIIAQVNDFRESQQSFLIALRLRVNAARHGERIGFARAVAECPKPVRRNVK